MCQARRRLLGPLRTLPERHFGPLSRRGNGTPVMRGRGQPSGPEQATPTLMGSSTA